MSHSVSLPPVHDTSPPPFDDDVDEDDVVPTIQNDEFLSSTSPDVLNNSNDDDWKSVDNNNDTDIAQIQDDIAIVNDENVSTDVNLTNEDTNDDWANFATFENATDEVSEVNNLLYFSLTLHSIRKDRFSTFSSI
jgi:hypothetical protein